MGYRFVFTEWFNRNLRSLGKGNPTLRNDLETFLQLFDAEAHPIIPGTGGARKARMKAKGKGKRGGYRVIYYFTGQDRVWFITIYDKVRQENLSPEEQTHVSELLREIKDLPTDEANPEP
jgi:mRNA-degrading endonuclease RelE of RelBE toxin-antitoxin system